MDFSIAAIALTIVSIFVFLIFFLKLNQNLTDSERAIKDLKKQSEDILSLINTNRAELHNDLLEKNYETNQRIDRLKLDIEGVGRSLNALQIAFSSAKEDFNCKLSCVSEVFEETSSKFKSDISDLQSDLLALRDQLSQLSSDVNRMDYLLSIQDASRNLMAPASPEPPSVPLLDQDQNSALSAMYSGKNVFITGRAGTGKSYLLRKFVSAAKKNVLILAPTGISARNVGGVTLHSAFGFDLLTKTAIQDIVPGKLFLSAERAAVLKHADVIVIDEISMVRADTFDKIDRTLRVVMQKDVAFGGKQILVFGDLLQLPPIVSSDDVRKYLDDLYGGIFFFYSYAYKSARFQFVELTENHRQHSDNVFFDLLGRIRTGEYSEKDIALLNQHVIEQPSEQASNLYKLEIPFLLPTKIQVEKKNRERLSSLDFEEFTYEAIIKEDNRINPTKYKGPEDIFPISQTLRLKVGALVMMVANDPEHRWVNGTMGYVHMLSSNSITVSIDGKDYDLQRQVFTAHEARYDSKKKKIIYKDIYSVSQFPLILAYAITIHKSQGQSYQRIVVDVDRCFSSGHAYVALSRCETLDGLRLLRTISPGSIKVSADVLEFYQQQRLTFPSQDVMLDSQADPISEEGDYVMEESYITDVAANGMTVRIPASRYTAWRKRQDELKEHPLTEEEREEVLRQIRAVQGE